MLRAPFLAIAILTSSGGCVAREYNNKADLHHDTAQVTAGARPTNWGAIPTLGFVDGLREFDKYSMDTLADSRLYWHPENPHVAQQRLQAWVNRIHEAVRATPWGQRTMARIPTPTVIIREDPTLNAFVAGGLVIYPADVAYDVPAEERKTLEGDIITWTEGRLDTAVANKRRNIIVAGDPRLLPDVIERERAYASFLGTKCMPIWSPGKVTFTPECGPMLVKGKNFASQQTLPFVTVHSGLVKKYPEDQVVGVIAHELAHYYRAHGTDTTKLGSFIMPTLPEAEQNINTLRQGYIYRENSFQISKEALPERDVNVIVRLLKYVNYVANPVLDPFPGEALDRQVVADYLKAEISSYNANWADDTKWANLPVAKTWYGTEYVPFPAYLNLKCPRFHNAPQECQEFLAISQKPGVIALASNPLFGGQATPQDQQDFLRAGILLKSILRNLTINEREKESVNSPVLTMDVHFLAFSGGTVAYFKWLLSIREAQARPTAMERAMKATELNSDLRNQAARDRQWVRDERLSWYTVEQEADSLALQYMSMVGLNPSQLIEVKLSFLGEDGANHNRALFGFSAEECRQMYRDQFNLINPKNQAVMLDSQVDWMDNHHNLCYRAFNMLREIKLHGYTNRTDLERPRLGGSWAEVQAQIPEARAAQIDLGRQNEIRRRVWASTR